LEAGVHKFLIHKRGDHVGVATSAIGVGESVVGVYMDDDAPSKEYGGQGIGVICPLMNSA
jgi:hypothetical protein